MKSTRICRTCQHSYTGSYCKNRSCVKNQKARARLREAAKRRRGGGGRKPRLSTWTPGDGQLAVNTDALPVKSETLIERANADDALFMALCAEDTLALEAICDEFDYSRGL